MLTPFEQFEIILLKFVNVGMFDISITNNVVMLISIALIIIILQYIISRHYTYIVTNAQYIIETIYEFVLSLVAEQSGKKGYKYFPYLYTIFILILLYNVCGLLPFSFTVSSQVIITFTLALSFFLAWISFLQAYIFTHHKSNSTYITHFGKSLKHKRPYLILTRSYSTPSVNDFNDQVFKRSSLYLKDAITFNPEYLFILDGYYYDTIKSAITCSYTQLYNIPGRLHLVPFQEISRYYNLHPYTKKV